MLEGGLPKTAIKCADPKGCLKKAVSSKSRKSCLHWPETNCFIMTKAIYETRENMDGRHVPMNYLIVTKGIYEFVISLRDS